MKMTIESTELLFAVDGLPCRVWEGKSAGGEPVCAFVLMVGVQEGASANLEEFERDLHQHVPISVRGREVVLSFVLEHGGELDEDN